jgi:hypothetical protein
LRGNVLVTNSGESKLKNWSNEIQDFPPFLNNPALDVCSRILSVFDVGRWAFSASGW